MRSRLVVASVALVALTIPGCGGDEDQRPASVARARMRPPHLERPELVAFRAAEGAKTVRYELLASRANGEVIRALIGGSQRDRLRPALFDRAAWSPDGRRLAFTAELGPLAGFATDIYVMRADGSGLRRLTSGSRSFHPLWASDGRRILFAHRPKGRPSLTESDARRLASASIWSMRPDGSDQRQVTRLVSGRSDVPESFSPNGATLALTRTAFVEIDEHGRAANTAEVWVMRPDGSDARRLADRSSDPAFSPDGRRIAFASDRDENGVLSYGDRTFFANELYVMDAVGSHARRLTRTKHLNERQPSWLPTGSRIAYQRGKVLDNAEGTVVMQANADGRCARPILADASLNIWYAAPAWRPGQPRTGDKALRC